MRIADTMTARDLLALRHSHSSSPRLAA
jgi:hypothetical protein